MIHIAAGQLRKGLFEFSERNEDKAATSPVLAGASLG
jgi:hypothetical protein